MIRRQLLTGERVDAGWDAVLNQASEPGLMLHLKAQQLGILFLFNLLLSRSRLALLNWCWFLRGLGRRHCRSWGWVKKLTRRSAIHTSSTTKLPLLGLWAGSLTLLCSRGTISWLSLRSDPPKNVTLCCKPRDFVARSFKSPQRLISTNSD